MDGTKIITNSGFGSLVSQKTELLSRLTACQSTTINDTPITKFEKNEMISKIFGNSVKDNFKFFDVSQENENILLGFRHLIMDMKKIWLLIKENLFK